ncbi:MAG: hypothetical protein V4641_21480, partial [Pseudomonadota bacterium]
MKTTLTFAATALALAFALPHAGAAVTADEAAKLHSTLTPLGAEKSGNKDGTIPAWDGAYAKVPAGFKPGEEAANAAARENMAPKGEIEGRLKGGDLNAFRPRGYDEPIAAPQPA